MKPPAEAVQEMLRQIMLSMLDDIAAYANIDKERCAEIIRGETEPTEEERQGIVDFVELDNLERIGLL